MVSLSRVALQEGRKQAGKRGAMDGVDDWLRAARRIGSERLGTGLDIDFSCRFSERDQGQSRQAVTGKAGSASGSGLEIKKEQSAQLN
jgi:hypothetical protein